MNTYEVTWRWRWDMASRSYHDHVEARNALAARTQFVRNMSKEFAFEKGDLVIISVTG